MNDSSEVPEVLSLNARHLSVGQLNERLRESSASVSLIEIVGCQDSDLLASGITYGGRLLIDGNLGDYCLCGVSDVEVELRGNAGCGLGEAMQSGSILVHGNAGDAVGAFNRGGLIAIYGNAGRRTGIRMSGGDIVVKGSIGSQGGMEMTAGGLMILGSTGAMLGHRMSGGTIYVRGDIESLSEHIEETRLREADRLRISLLLLNSGLEGDARGMRAYRAVNT